MIPQFGQTLVDARTGESRFRLKRYFRQGRSFDLLLAEDTLHDDRLVVIKSIRYDDHADAARIAERRTLVSVESEALSSVHPALPYPEAVVFVDNPELAALDPTLKDGEPLLIYRHIDAEPLPAWLARRYPDGAPANVAMDVIRQVAAALDALHEHGFVHRCVSPDHILVDAENTVSLVGMGNAIRKNSRVSATKDFFHEQFSAPEIERELSGKFVIPRADMYSLGCVLGFLVSGEAPTGYPESPWSRVAHERILAQPAGVGLLVAHCTQPMAKKRFAHMGRILPFLDLEQLPDKTHRDFAELTLTVPWLGNRPDAARVGHLSPGPLVNRSGITQGIRAIDLPPANVIEDTSHVSSGLPAAPDTGPLPASDSSGAPTAARHDSDFAPVSAAHTAAQDTETTRLSRWTLIVGIIVIVLAVIAVLRQIPSP
jgi:hypothetical protein